MKAFDIVRTPKGALAVVVETNKGGKEASITFIGGGSPYGEHNAWWDEGELVLVDSITRIIADAMAHPFGKGREDVNIFFK
jgi:hypothetical protein